jgi:hypothetical protein
VFIQTQFDGTLVAPNANVTLAAIGTSSYHGAFFGKSLTLQADVKVQHRSKCGPTGGLTANGSCQELAPDARVVPAANVVPQGPNFDTVAAAVNYIAGKLQADPTIGTVHSIGRDAAGVPISIALDRTDTGPVAVVEPNNTLTFYPSRFALLVGGRAGAISLTGGQLICLKDQCAPICPAGQVADESGQCVCSGGQLTQEDGTCACPDNGQTLIDGICQCPPDSFEDETGACFPLAEAAVFRPESITQSNLEFSANQTTHHSEFVPYIPRWIPFISRLVVNWNNAVAELSGGYQESTVFCWKGGFIPWACTQKTGRDSATMSLVFHAGEAVTQPIFFNAADFGLFNKDFMSFFVSLKLNDAGTIVGGGGNCSTPECSVTGECALTSMVGNSTSRTDPPNRQVILSTGVNCSDP